jgi:hypothetical protein
MATYIFAVLGLVGLCVGWALLQLWVNKVDPDPEARSIKCGGCDQRCYE